MTWAATAVSIGWLVECAASRGLCGALEWWCSTSCLLRACKLQQGRVPKACDHPAGGAVGRGRGPVLGRDDACGHGR
eukprot:scaffold70253_cov23-Tisochrysis_lutea.AAC.3